jgi:glucose-6-phosphate 1-dehydrogenase
VSGDYKDPDTFAAIKKALGDAKRPAHYLAIPPSLFETVIKGLGAAKLAEHARVIVEKPFGRDLASARNSTASRGRCSRKTRSSASTTSSGRRRS